MSGVSTSAHLRAFTALLARDQDASGLHNRDLQVIALLCEHNEPMTVGTVAAMLDVTAPYISRIAEKLVSRRLLSRVENPTDRRLVNLTVTSEGQALDERVRAHYQRAGSFSAA